MIPKLKLIGPHKNEAGQVLRNDKAFVYTFSICVCGMHVCVCDFLVTFDSVSHLTQSLLIQLH